MSFFMTIHDIHKDVMLALMHGVSVCTRVCVCVCVCVCVYVCMGMQISRTIFVSCSLLLLLLPIKAQIIFDVPFC